MSERVARLLCCDAPGCGREFGAAVDLDVGELRGRARLAGWEVFGSDGAAEDRCPGHADRLRAPGCSGGTA